MTLLPALNSLSPSAASVEEFYAAHQEHFRTHHIQAVLAHEIEERDDISDETRSQAGDCIHAARGRHALYIRGLERIISILDRSGFSYALIKGAGLWSYYPHPWLREQDDIDIILRPIDAPRFLDLLAGEALKVASSESHGAHLSLHFEEDGLPDLEIHTATGPIWKNSLSDDYVLDNTETLSVDGLDIIVPNETVRLRLALQHAANHHVLTRLQWLHEIALMLETGMDTDWIQELTGMEARSAGAVLYYAGGLSDSDKLAAALFRIRPGTIFLKLLKKIIPEDNLLTNPVCTSRLRRHLFNVLLVRNPLKIAKGFSQRS